MAELGHFLFNSDYPADKIVYMKKDTYTIAHSQGWQPQFIFIDSGIGTQLYVEGDYRFDGSDEVYPLDGHSGPLPASSVASFMKDGTCYVVPIFVTTKQEYVGKKVEYRVWAYCGDQEAKNADINGTANIAKPKLAFTSDDNYPRFIGEGRIPLGQTYNHNLGYIPLVKSWRIWKNTTIPMPSGDYTADSVEPMSVVYFGDPGANQDPFRGEVYQVSKTSIKTFADEGTNDDDVYFRMYIL